MEKNKSNKLFFTALIVGSIVYLVKDILLHEYKYWQCNKTQQIVSTDTYKSYPEYKGRIVKGDMITCLNIINGVK